MKVYLCARYSKNPEMREVAEYLRLSFGMTITSRWINGSHEIGDRSTDEGRATLAHEDFEDLKAADCLLAFSEPPRTVSNQRGGRHVEFGIALALGLPIFVVGPKENVFHYLPPVRNFDSIKDAAQAIAEANGK